jgi:hypothetical protein
MQRYKFYPARWLGSAPYFPFFAMDTWNESWGNPAGIYGAWSSAGAGFFWIILFSFQIISTLLDLEQGSFK